MVEEMLRSEKNWLTVSFATVKIQKELPKEVRRRNAERSRNINA